MKRKSKSRKPKKRKPSPINPLLYSKSKPRVPVVEDGFRIVGPAQAVMDYAKPVIEIMGESEKALQTALNFAQ